MKSSEKKGYVISDFHFLSEQDLKGPAGDKLESLAREADFLVIAGDMLDFRRLQDQSNQLMHDAIVYLDALLTRNPDCRVFYVLGNHDGLAFLHDALKELSARRANFEVCPVSLRFGDRLFFHGDLPFEKHLPEPLERPRVMRDKRPKRLRGRCYLLILRWRLHRGPFTWFLQWFTATGITRWLGRTPDEYRRGIREVYFGHIHLPFAGYRKNGMVFHNSGSWSVNGGNFLELTVPEEELQNPRMD